MKLLLRILFLSSLLIGVSSCIHRQNHFEQKTFSIRADCQNNFYSLSATTTLISEDMKDCLYSIAFEAVRGGDNLLLGIKVNEHDAYKTKRLTIKRNNLKIANVSISELMKYQEATGRKEIVLEELLLSL